MFDAQVAALRDRYRCIAFDFRGHGRSAVARTGYDMDTLAEDAAALIATLGAVPCHFAGLSMGGFIALRLAARRPELLRSLILLETSARPEPAQNVPRYRALALATRIFGVKPLAPRIMPIMFGQKFLTDPARAQQRAEWLQRGAANNRTGIIRATVGVISRRGVADELGRITAPTLIIVGDQDVATRPQESQFMHEHIASSQLVIVPGAGHTSTVEEPAAVTAALAAFLEELPR